VTKFLMVLVLVATLSVSALAEASTIIYGDVHFTMTIDDFSDEYSETVAVMEDATFMPKLFGFRCDHESFFIAYKHQSLVLEEWGKMLIRVNDHEPFEISVFLNDGFAIANEGDSAKLLRDVVLADKAGGGVQLVVMIKGDVDTKFKFGMNGAAEAVANSQLIKQILDGKSAGG